MIGLIISIFTLIFSGLTHHRIIEHKTRKAYEKAVKRILPPLKNIQKEMLAGEQKPEHRSTIIEYTEKLKGYAKYFTPEVKEAMNYIDQVLNAKPTVRGSMLDAFYDKGTKIDRSAILDNQPLIDALSRLIGRLSVRKETVLD